MPLQLDENGLQTQTQAEIHDEQEDILVATFGANLNTRTDSIMGQLVNILSELRADDQQALLAVYRSFDPSGAIGRALDARCTLTGTIRKGATHSSVSGLLTFSGVGTMNNGDLIRNDDNNTLWELVDGPHTGPGVIAAVFSAVDMGPILAQAGTDWSLVTSVSGLDSFTNPTDDAEVGRNQETDADLRKRRNIELYSQGEGPLVAIRGRVSRIDGVVYARVWHNPATYPVDGDGIPFKAFRVVVETNPTVPTTTQRQAIWDAIWLAMGAGGQAYGTDYPGTSVDSEGTAQPVAFDAIDVKTIEIEIDLVTTGTEDPITPNLATVVHNEVLMRAQAELEQVARDVRRIDIQGFVADMLEEGRISGPFAVNVRMNISPGSATSVDRLVMGQTDKPDFDSVNITVIQV